jgi:hypothetical protein
LAGVFSGDAYDDEETLIWTPYSKESARAGFAAQSQQAKTQPP